MREHVDELYAASLSSHSDQELFDDIEMRDQADEADRKMSKGSRDGQNLDETHDSKLNRDTENLVQSHISGKDNNSTERDTLVEEEVKVEMVNEELDVVHPVKSIAEVTR